MTDKAISGTDSRENDRLLPCPFCGDKATFALEGELHTVGCINPGCRGDWFMSKLYESTEKASEAWNKRSERTCRYVEDPDTGFELCSECGAPAIEDWTAYYCWSCGAKVVES